MKLNRFSALVIGALIHTAHAQTTPVEPSLSPNFVREGDTIYVSGHLKNWFGRLMDTMVPRNYVLAPVRRVVFVNTTSERPEKTTGAAAYADLVRPLQLESVIVGSCDLFCARIALLGKTRTLGAATGISDAQLAFQIPIDYESKQLERRFPHTQLAVFESAIPDLSRETKDLLTQAFSKPTDATGGLFVDANSARYCNSVKLNDCQTLPGLNASAMKFTTTSLVSHITLPKSLPAPVATGYASLEDVSAVPVRGDSAMAYKTFLASPNSTSGRAFALSKATGSSGWGSAWGGEDPAARALARCEAKNGGSCQLYAVDDYVVWK